MGFKILLYSLLNVYVIILYISPILLLHVLVSSPYTLSFCYFIIRITIKTDQAITINLN